MSISTNFRIQKDVLATALLSKTNAPVNISTSSAPLAGETLVATSATTATWQTVSPGISGPITSTNNGVVRWDGTTGDVVKDSSVLIDDSGNIIDNTAPIASSTDITRKLAWSIGGSTGTTTTFFTAPTANRAFRTPDIDGTILVSQDSTGQVFINSTTSLHGSNAGLQLSSTVANRGAGRFNQYGVNTGVPGITGFKSRGATIGSLAGVIDGDVLFRDTAIGVAPDNSSIPLAGTISITVPTGGSAGANNWVAADYDIQLTPLAGPINGRKQAFRVDSEGILHIKESANTMAGIATLSGAGTATVSNTRVSATTKFTLTVQQGTGVVQTGHIYQSARNIGANFTISSTAGVADNGVQVYYQLWEPTTP